MVIFHYENNSIQSIFISSSYKVDIFNDFHRHWSILLHIIAIKFYTHGFARMDGIDDQTAVPNNFQHSHYVPLKRYFAIVFTFIWNVYKLVCGCTLRAREDACLFGKTNFTLLFFGGTRMFVYMCVGYIFTLLKCINSFFVR